MDHWCFAIVNGRLAEILFDEKGDEKLIRGHCYVIKKEYPTKQERRWIVKDTKRNRFSYSNKQYQRLLKK